MEKKNRCFECWYLIDGNQCKVKTGMKNLPNFPFKSTNCTAFQRRVTLKFGRKK
jgi:hypothetical protein